MSALMVVDMLLFTFEGSQMLRKKGYVTPEHVHFQQGTINPDHITHTYPSLDHPECTIVEFLDFGKCNVRCSVLELDLLIEQHREKNRGIHLLN